MSAEQTPPIAVRTSSCSPWILGEDVSQTALMQQAIANAKALSAKPNSGFVLSDDMIETICANSAAQATALLYKFSGRQFAGKCGPVTIRPVGRPVNADALSWTNRNWSYGGYGATSGMMTGQPGVVQQYMNAYPPEIQLFDYPIRTIECVKIDGVVIPPDEYELREHHRLVRIRPTISSVPTDRWGWPTSQIPDLPDTEIGTFSITYTFGMDCGVDGRAACVKLAEALALPQLGDSTHYPTRVYSFSRQGVSAQVASIYDVMKQGGTGIYEVDMWLLAVNPTKRRRQAVVWSPDRAPNRRQNGVTLN